MLRKFSFACILLLLLLVISSCNRADEYDERIIYAMDTVISIKINKSDISDDLLREAENIIASFEDKYSRTREDSVVSAFNESSDGIITDDHAVNMITQCIELSDRTEGAFDITCEPLISLWNVTAPSPSVPTNEQIAFALSKVGYRQLKSDNGCIAKERGDISIDLGSVAKGACLGKIVDYLSSNGAEYGTVSFGGNIGVIGEKPSHEPWRIGIKSPYDTQSVIGYISIENGYAAVSGDYERYFEQDGVRYHHILDPTTGYPSDNGLHSVTVVCDDGLTADALSTALFVMGYEKSIDFYKEGIYDFEAVFVTDSGTFITDGLKERFISNVENAD